MWTPFPPFFSQWATTGPSLSLSRHSFLSARVALGLLLDLHPRRRSPPLAPCRHFSSSARAAPRCRFPFSPLPPPPLSLLFSSSSATTSGSELGAGRSTPAGARGCSQLHLAFGFLYGGCRHQRKRRQGNDSWSYRSTANNLSNQQGLWIRKRSQRQPAVHHHHGWTA